MSYIEDYGMSKEIDKCPKCGQDEKYVVHMIKNNNDIEVRVCAKQCRLPKDKKC